MEKPKNILIVRTDRIGDVVLSLPLAKIIKQKYPNAKITYLLKNYTKDLAYKHPYIDDLLILEEEEGKIKFGENIKNIKKGNFDFGIVVYPTFKISLILFLARVKTRIGTGYRWYSFLFNKKNYEHRKYGEKHELEYNLNLLKLLNIEKIDTKHDISFDIQIDEKSKQIVEDLLQKNGFDPNIPTVIIHPGSGGSAIDLPISKFREMTESLARELSLNVLITGSEHEKGICNRIKNGTGSLNLAGMFNLKEFIALIDKADILIANSTGPIHIAGAMGKYVIGFYPQIPALSPKRWGPYTDKKVIFTPKLDCENCTREKCEELDCMNTIDINEVVNAVKQILQGKNEKFEN